jgi:transcriptional regulator with XRE-family HTH domain
MTRPHQPRTRFELQAAGRVRHITQALAADLSTARIDAGLSVRQLAAAAGVSAAAVRSIEQVRVEPTLQVVARLSEVLGMSFSARLYPGTGPAIRDRFQAPIMIEALLAILDERWRPRPEVPVVRPVRGVIDLVLDDVVGDVCVACEAQSELRRLEQQVRWSRAKADALALARQGDADRTPERMVGRLLLLRSTERTRAIVSLYSGLVAAAYPARTRDAYAALTGTAPWPGDALIWCRVQSGRATVLEGPPRGIGVGR